MSIRIRITPLLLTGVQLLSLYETAWQFFIYPSEMGIFSLFVPPIVIFLGRKVIEVFVLFPYFFLIYSCVRFFRIEGVKRSGLVKFFCFIFNRLHTTLSMRNTTYGGFSVFYICLVRLLFIVTIIELIPYTVLIKPSLHWLMVIRIGYYFRMTLSSLINSPSFFFSSYVVSGQNLLRYFFLCPIEVFSQSLRPLTLSFRMALNLASGVVLIKFIWLGVRYLGSLSFFLVFVSFIIWVFLSLFEVSIIILHVGIFSSLLLLYEGDHGEKAVSKI